MSAYSVVLFLHIVGALLLFVLLTVETFSLRIGRSPARFNQIAGPISAVLILFPGLYMVATAWGWIGWIVVGITAWLAIAVLGAITGVLVLRGRMSMRTAALSWSIRLGLATGVLFVMTTKPDAILAVVAVVVGALLGLAVDRVTGRRTMAS